MNLLEIIISIFEIIELNNIHSDFTKILNREFKLQYIKKEGPRYLFFLSYQIPNMGYICYVRTLLISPVFTGSPDYLAAVEYRSQLLLVLTLTAPNRTSRNGPTQMIAHIYLSIFRNSALLLRANNTIQFAAIEYARKYYLFSCTCAWLAALPARGSAAMWRHPVRF